MSALLPAILSPRLPSLLGLQDFGAPGTQGGGGLVLVAPVNTVAPVASGTVTIGGSLSTTNGTWTGTPAPTFTYQWRRDGVSIGGATASSYTPVAADIGPAIDCLVTATNAAGSASADSNNLAFAMTQFTNLRAWYRSDLGITLDGSDVAAWADQSGRGNDLVAASSSVDPVYNATDAQFNNKPSVEGDGVGEWLRDTAVSFSAAFGPNCTIGAVLRLVTNTNGRVPLSLNNSGMRLVETTVGRLQYSATGAGGTVTSTSDFSAASRHILAIGDGSNISIRVNDTSEGTPQTYTGSVADGVALALFSASNGTAFSATKYAEVFLQGATISASERADWDAYVNNRYSV